MLLPGRRRAAMRRRADGAAVCAPLQRRAVRRLVLARAPPLLELGVRRLAVPSHRRVLRVSSLLLSLVALPSGAEPDLRIVATLPDLFLLPRAVAGDLATVDLIARF